MAFKLIANLRDSVSGILQGLNLNNVKNLNTALERTVRVMAQEIDIPEATARTYVNLFDGVFDYLSPSDIFGGAVIDLRPQGISRQLNDYNYRQDIALFDRTKAWLPNGYAITFENIGALQVMRIANTKANPMILLDDLSVTTGWATGGNASGLTQDQTVFYQIPASLRFNISASGSQAYIEKTIPSNDLTAYQGVGTVFVAVKLPTATDITSIGVRIGSDNANYYDVSNTQGQLGAFFSGDWLLIPLNLANASKVGNPVITAIKYLRIYFNYDGVALNNVYVGYCFIALPSPHTLIYKTPSIFQNAGGVILSTITNNSDTVLLKDDAYVIYEHECALSVALQQGGSLAVAMVETIGQKLNGIRARNGLVVQLGLYDIYRANNPSQEERQVGSYYDE